MLNRPSALAGGYFYFLLETDIASSTILVIWLYMEKGVSRNMEKSSSKEIESTCPECGKPIYTDENALTGFCEECSKEK